MKHDCCSPVVTDKSFFPVLSRILSRTRYVLHSCCRETALTLNRRQAWMYISYLQFCEAVRRKEERQSGKKKSEKMSLQEFSGIFQVCFAFFYQWSIDKSHLQAMVYLSPRGNCMMKGTSSPLWWEERKCWEINGASSRRKICILSYQG